MLIYGTTVRPTCTQTLDLMASELRALADEYERRAHDLRSRRQTRTIWADRYANYAAARLAYDRVKAGQSTQRATQWAVDNFNIDCQQIETILTRWQDREEKERLYRRNEAIKKQARRKVTHRVIAERFGISTSQVSRIVNTKPKKAPRPAPNNIRLLSPDQRRATFKIASG